MNQVILIGYVKSELEIKDSKNGFQVGHFLIEVERPYVNAEGETDTDLFQVTIWRSLVEEFQNRYQVGDLIGIRGRLQANNYYKDENETYYRADVVAERMISFDKK